MLEPKSRRPSSLDIQKVAALPIQVPVVYGRVKVARPVSLLEKQAFHFDTVFFFFFSSEPVSHELDANRHLRHKARVW